VKSCTSYDSRPDDNFEFSQFELESKDVSSDSLRLINMKAEVRTNSTVLAQKNSTSHVGRHAFKAHRTALMNTKG
jgi:hypothetical protein